MSFVINGVLGVDNFIMSQRASDVHIWLKAGFDLLASDNIEARMSAFPPLELAPDRDLLSQLATALREAYRADLSCTARVRSIIRERLRQPAVINNEPTPHLTAFWRLLGAIECKADVSADARLFLNDLLRLRYEELANNNGGESLTELIDAVVNCVAASKPASASQTAFMRFLRNKKSLWSSRYLETFVDCVYGEVAASRVTSPSEADRRIEAWCDLRTELSEDLGKRADPETAVGRSLLRSIARYVDISISEQSGPRGARQLRATLWQINCKRDKPLLTLVREETLEEAFS